MNKKLSKIYDQLFEYIADIEGLQDDDYYAILGNLNTLIGHILNVEKWNKKEKKWKLEGEYKIEENKDDNIQIGRKPVQ